MPRRAARSSSPAEPVVRAVSFAACRSPLRGESRLRRRAAAGTEGPVLRWQSGGRAWRGRLSPRRGRDEDLLERFELLEALATADRHAVEGITGHHDGHPRLLLQPGVETVEQGAATGEHD